jgi:hypothetical protein
VRYDGDEPEAEESGSSTDEAEDELDLGSDSNESEDMPERMEDVIDEQEILPGTSASGSLAAEYE